MTFPRERSLTHANSTLLVYLTLFITGIKALSHVSVSEAEFNTVPSLPPTKQEQRKRLLGQHASRATRLYSLLPRRRISRLRPRPSHQVQFCRGARGSMHTDHMSVAAGYCDSPTDDSPLGTLMIIVQICPSSCTQKWGSYSR